MHRGEGGIRAWNRPAGDGEDIESILSVVEMVACQICIGGADHALLFREADGVFGWFGVLPGFHFDKNKDVFVPRDDIDFTGFGIGSRR
jgi:hypothetical protein